MSFTITFGCDPNRRGEKGGPPPLGHIHIGSAFEDKDMARLHFNVPNKVVYTNWKGVTSERVIIPKHIWHGSTEYHKEPQFLVSALDVDKNEMRDFALKDMQLIAKG